MLQQVCAVRLVLQNFYCAYYLQSSGLVELTNGTIKTRLAKFVEILQIPWPKVLPLVLLNLKPTPFRTHKLSPFEIATGHPMLLAPASFDLQLIKEDKTQYCKGLIASIQNNHALIEQSFYRVLSGEEDLKHHTFQSGDFIYWKRHLQKDSL